MFFFGGKRLNVKIILGKDKNSSAFLAVARRAKYYFPITSRRMEMGGIYFPAEIKRKLIPIEMAIQISFLVFAKEDF